MNMHILAQLDMAKSNSASFIFPLNLDTSNEHKECDITVLPVSRLAIRPSFPLLINGSSEKIVLLNHYQDICVS